MGELLLDTVKGVVYVWVTEELPKSTLGVCVKCNNPWENGAGGNLAKVHRKSNVIK